MFGIENTLNFTQHSQIVKETLLEEGMNSTINHHYSLKHQMMGQYFTFDLQVMGKRQYFLDIVDSLFNYVSYLIIKTQSLSKNKS